MIIDYTSNKLLGLLSQTSLNKIENTFNIDIIKTKSDMLMKKSIDKYTEPAISKPADNNSKGYSKNDNDSLDKLFNIESEN